MGKVGAIIVAAGSGTRMKSKEKKQFLMLDHKPILVHTLQTWSIIEDIDEIVVVTNKEEVQRCAQYLIDYDIQGTIRIVEGGSERQSSVYCGLQAFGKDVEWVLVHDGVRPLAKKEHILACLHKAQTVEAAILAVPVKETIKLVDETLKVSSTLPRERLWTVQTPQAFRYSLLESAHEAAIRDGFQGTDDAMLVEEYGGTVHVVEGDYLNVKLTTPEDFIWMQRLLQSEQDRD